MVQPRSMRARGKKTMNREKSRVTETRYTTEFAEEVCRRMAEGASLREVCRDNAVSESTVRQWVRDDRDGFAARYQGARCQWPRCVRHRSTAYRYMARPPPVSRCSARNYPQRRLVRGIHKRQRQRVV